MIRIFIKIRLWGLPILFSLVIVLLPPSETKHTGGDGPPLRLGALSFPALRSLRADDPIPAYRLSAGSKLPGQPTLAARWRPVLESVLADIATEELVVDLRSGSYEALGRLSTAVHVDVVAEHADGHRTVVSHFNKAHKGRLARALVSSRAEPDDAATVAAIARRAGMRVERDGNELTVIVDA
jgi:cytoplasmic iron level regulating protein YaaA (DUF328/UPF0246 family)